MERRPGTVCVGTRWSQAGQAGRHALVRSALVWGMRASFLRRGKGGRSTVSITVKNKVSVPSGGT